MTVLYTYLREIVLTTRLLRSETLSAPLRRIVFAYEAEQHDKLTFWSNQAVVFVLNIISHQLIQENNVPPQAGTQHTPS